MLNCQSDYGCGTFESCEHDPKWRMFNFEEYFPEDHYDFLTIGCSVSYGSEIKKSETWRSHLQNSIDLSVPGIGIDAIWHNLKFIASQDRVKFKKIIVLLPDIMRKTFRVYKEGTCFNFISTVHDENNPNPNFAFNPRQTEKLIKDHRRYLVLKGERYGARVLSKFIDWLNNNGQENIYVSSWNDLVFDTLVKKVFNKDLVLPKFDYDHANDKSIKHPSPGAHKKWFNSISEKIA